MAGMSADAASAETARPSRLVHIHSHTGLRGLASLLVVAYHLQFGEGYRFPFEGHDSFLGRGYIWVDLFFVLSGFIISYTANAERERGFSWLEARHFMRQRLARIYPLHIFCLAYLVAYLSLMALVFAAAGKTTDTGLWGSESLTALAAQILLLQSWWPPEWTAWNIPSWSISAELFAYFMFLPLVWLHGRSRSMGLLILLTIPAAFYLWIGLSTGDLDIVSGLAPLRCLAGFCLGMMIYYARRICSRMPAPTLSAVQIISSAAIISGLILDWNDIAFILPFCALVLSTWTDRGLGANILSSRQFQTLGDISYSMYLNHVPVIMILSFFWIRLADRLPMIPDPLLRIMFLLITFTSLIVISLGTLKYVEKPARSYLIRKGARQKSVESQAYSN